MALAVAPGALAASPVISDCNANGRLTRHYSVSQLQTALSTMPADVKEYTDCYDVIQRTLLSEASGSHLANPGSSQASTGGSFLPTPVIVVLVLVVLAGATLGAFVVRRRRHLDAD